jgi:hypothetical protein
VWVQVPVLTNGAAILARWGNPNATAPHPNDGTGAVWSNGYIGVWHLNETSGDHLDSSPRLATARATQPGTQGTAAGIAGGADNFGGAGDYVSLPDMGTLPTVTVECWANLNAVPADALRGLVSSDPFTPGVTHFRTGSNLLVTAAINSGGTASSATNSVTVGSWFHAGYVVAGSGAGQLQLFLNGNVAATANGHASNDLTDVNLAREYGGRYLNARLDEVRISNVPRSTNWLWATYQNIASNGSFNRYSRVLPINFEALPPADLNALQLNGAVLLFQIAGATGYTYTVQASTNLTDWTNLFVSNSPVLPFNWNDTNTSNFLKRFYRVLLGP